MITHTAVLTEAFIEWLNVVFCSDIGALLERRSPRRLVFRQPPRLLVPSRPFSVRQVIPDDAHTAIKKWNLANLKMDKFDVEQLIREIQLRPILWDMKLPDYTDRIKRRQCWEEITNIFAHEEMKVDERKHLGK